jgi:hypothetical protein
MNGRVHVIMKSAGRIGWTLPRLSSWPMSQGDDLRIVLRDPVGFSDRIVEHPDQPGEYVDDHGTWEQTDPSASWRLVDGSHLRVYDLVEPMTG